MSLLAHEFVRANEKVAESTILFFHGMLGRRSNLRGFSKRFVNDKFQALIIDHRGHGDSGGDFPAPHTLDACVEDVQRLVEHLKKEGSLLKDPTVAIGHSFGGKVALKWRAASDSTKLVWTLDCAPAAVNPKYFDQDNKRESVMRLKRELRHLPPWKTRADLIRVLTALDFSSMVAQWMTTNVAQKTDGSFGFAFDMDIVDELFDDYCKQDLFPTLASKNLDKQVHFLRAGRNRLMWTEEILSKFEQYVDKDTVHLHTMPKAGHFLHAESPQEVHDIIKPTLDSDRL